MKVFKVTVPDEKRKFFTDLMNNLNFEWKKINQPEQEKQPEKVVQPPAYELDEDARKKAAQLREESLKDVITKIEEMRHRR